MPVNYNIHTRVFHFTFHVSVCYDFAALPFPNILPDFMRSGSVVLTPSVTVSGLSYGNTTTGAAWMPAHRSLRKLTNFITISLRNCSSRVKRSKIMKARIYLKGITRRLIAEPSSTTATSNVTCKKPK